jgi:hypothetical protein
MPAFRGIGDTATQVKMQQDEMALRAAQISENARQANMSQASQAAGRAQQAQQFNQSLGEQGRQFDASQAAGEGREAWRQGFAEKQAGVANAMDERKLNLSEFGAMLNAKMTEAELAGKGVDTKARLAQLNQYVAATADEDKRRKNREQMAKGAFGSLAVAGIMNGGVMPSSAIELANRELGDKDNRIVGGGIDPASGIAWYDVQKADGTKTQLKMPPENQFAVLKEVYGDDVAGMFASNYKQNAAVSAAIERARVTAEGKASVEAAKTTAKQQDPLRLLEATRKSVEAKLKLAELTTDITEREKLQGEARAGLAEYDKMLRGAMPGGEQTTASVAPAEITPEALEANGIPSDAKVAVNPQTGKRMAVWRANGVMNTREIGEGGDVAPAKSAPAAASGGFGTMGGSGTPLPAPAAKTAPAQAAPPTASSPFATSFTTPGMDQVEASDDKTATASPFATSFTTPGMDQVAAEDETPAKSAPTVIKIPPKQTSAKPAAAKAVSEDPEKSAGVKRKEILARLEKAYRLPNTPEKKETVKAIKAELNDFNAAYPI